MCKWFKEMNCYILTGDESEPMSRTSSFDRRMKLEHSFRNYAAVFDKVKLVINKEQEKDEYLNFPHVCNETGKKHSTVDIARALEDADSDAVFIGTTDIYDFPLSLLAKLLKEYNGESFLGYVSDRDGGSPQPLFGIYNKRVSRNLPVDKPSAISFESVLDDDYKLLILPDEVDSSCIGL